MARTAQEQYDACDALIAQMEAEPMEEYSEGDERYRRAKLAELYAERARLAKQVQSEGAGLFRLAEPFDV